MSDITTTPGTWIVQPAECAGEGSYLAKIVSVQPNNELDLVALVLNMADAALMTSAKEMLDVLIVIQHELNSSKDVIDLVAMNTLISEVFEKIAAESGEL